MALRARGELAGATVTPVPTPWCSHDFDVRSPRVGPPQPDDGAAMSLDGVVSRNDVPASKAFGIGPAPVVESPGLW